MSLLEVVLAISLLSIILLAIFRLFAFSTLQNRRVNELDELNAVAERAMEYIKNSTVSESGGFVPLEDYTSDPATRERFEVAYSATKLPVPNPQGEGDITGELPSVSVNYEICVEVYYKRDADKIGSAGGASKEEAAKAAGVSFAKLVSALTQYE